MNITLHVMNSYEVIGKYFKQIMIDYPVLKNKLENSNDDIEMILADYYFDEEDDFIQDVEMLSTDMVKFLGLPENKYWYIEVFNNKYLK